MIDGGHQRWSWKTVAKAIDGRRSTPYLVRIVTGLIENNARVFNGKGNLHGTW